MTVQTIVTCYRCVVAYSFLEQDEGLDALSNVVARQKAMAIDIGTEVDQQNGKFSKPGKEREDSCNMLDYQGFKSMC